MDNLEENSELNFSARPKAKERLLKIALKNFAEKGFEGTSIRDVTHQAEVNISAIFYYFNDKEGLYKAVISLVSKKLKEELIPHISKATQLLENRNLTQEQTRKIIHESLRGTINFLMSNETSYYTYKIFMQEHCSPSVGFNYFFEEVAAPLNDNLSKTIATVLKIPYPSEEAILYAHTITGMVSIFRTHREASLRRLGWKEYGENEIEKITEIVIRNVDSIIDCYHKYRKT